MASLHEIRIYFSRFLAITRCNRNFLRISVYEMDLQFTVRKHLAVTPGGQAYANDYI